MPTIDGVYIVPGTGEVLFDYEKHTNSAGTVSVASLPADTSNYVVGDLSPSTFVNLTDGPGVIVPNALLMGGIQNNKHIVEWTTIPTSANQALVWSGSAFTWAVIPTFAGVMSVAIPFTETTTAINVATLNNVTLVSAKVIVKSVFGSDSTINLGTTVSNNAIIDTSQITQTQLGMYYEELYIPLSTSTAIQLYLNAPTGTTGAGTLILEYINGTN